MEKINIAELLKDCPSGMELDCLLFKDAPVYFNRITDSFHYPIEIKVEYPDGSFEKFELSKEGCIYNRIIAKCVIFPKGKTTWEGFVPPTQFNDGDIIFTRTGNYKWVSIFKQVSGSSCCTHIDLCINNNSLFSSHSLCNIEDITTQRIATEEEKTKLFDAIKANGYKWNEETKTLKKLIEPKFKVGDKIRHKETQDGFCTIRRVEDRYYVDGHPTCYTILFCKQDEYELVPNKFDLTTLKPFERVLVRDDDDESWEICLFGHCDESEFYQYKCINGCVYAQCIPYEGNEHLLGTTNDCDVLYKKWQL